METVCAWRDGRRKGKMRQIKKRIRKDADNYIHPSICETVILSGMLKMALTMNTPKVRASTKLLPRSIPVMPSKASMSTPVSRTDCE